MDSISVVMDALNNSYAAIGRPRSVLVGLSGGADSVALLVSLCELKKKYGFDLYAVHVNHGLRENAFLDEEFCQALCTQMSIPLFIERVCITAKSNIESEARTARYTAFLRIAMTTRAEVLTLAHHMDDQAETVIMHLLYGAGSTGISGMYEMKRNIWRPFLQIRRLQLRDYLVKKGFSWCEDESNADTAFTRNRIRACVIPEMEICAPEAVRAISRTAQIVQAEDDYLTEIAETWLSVNASKAQFPFLMVAPLQKEHPAMQRRILRRYAEVLSIEIDYIQTERLRKLLNENAGEVVNLPAGWRAFRSKDRLHFLNEQEKTNATVSGSLTIDDDKGSNEACYIQPLPPEQVHDLQLRVRRTGDFIQPFGMQGTKSLKEYMIDHAIDRPFRDSWPLVCRGNEVLWVIGVGASEKLRVHPNDKRTQMLIYSGELPDAIQKGD